jgi:hypothetical protein
MKFFKGLALGLVSLLLVISLNAMGLAIMLNTTLLNPSFIKNEMIKLDITSLAREISSQNPDPEIQPYLKDIGSLVSEIKPWIYSQVDSIVTSGYYYFNNKSSELNLVIDLDSIKPAIIKWASQIALANQSPDLNNGLNSDQISEQLNISIPSSITINAELLGTQNMQILGDIKKAVGIWQYVFYILWAITILWIVLLVLILSKTRDILRSLGIIFLIPGVCGLLLYFILRYATATFPFENFLYSLQTWIVQFVNDLFKPLGIYSGVLLAIGIIMLIGSFFINRLVDTKTNITVV